MPGLGARQISNPATSAPSGAGGGKGTRNQARTRKDSKDGKACKATGTNLKGGEGSGSLWRFWFKLSELITGTHIQCKL